MWEMEGFEEEVCSDGEKEGKQKEHQTKGRVKKGIGGFKKEEEREKEKGGKKKI